MMYLIVDNGDRRCVDHLRELIAQQGLESMTLARTASLDLIDRNPLKGVFLSGGDDIDLTLPVDMRDIALDLACIVDIDVPIFGICMGFEIIVAAFGGAMAHLPGPLPIDCVPVAIDIDEPVFRGLPGTICMPEFNMIHATAVPSVLRVVARSERSAIEAIVHDRRPIVATQFHPEAADRYEHQSIEGLQIVRNFLDLCERRAADPTGAEAS